MGAFSREDPPHHIVIATFVQVRPHQGRDGSGDQKDRVVEQELERRPPCFFFTHMARKDTSIGPKSESKVRPEIRQTGHDKDIVTVKSTSQLPSGDTFVSELDFNVKVSASTVMDFSLVGNDEITLEDSDFFDLDAGSEYEFLIKAKNIGNSAGTLTVDGSDVIVGRLIVFMIVF